MYETTYHRASDLSDAVAKVGGADDGKYLAGGMTLLPTMKQRLAAPSDLVDLTHIADLKSISVEGKSVKIGAMVTHYEVSDSSAVKSVCPGFSMLAGWIGDPAVRHRGTIGGSIANNDPAADYPAALLALDATIHTNQREIKADEFFTGMFETALEDSEVVTAVSFSAPDACGYEKFRNPASRYAMAGVFVAKTGGTVRVGVTGAGSDGAFRWSDAETALGSDFSPGSLDSLSLDPGDMLSDIHASSAYRANLVKVMAKRAVAAAG
jgi:carbon-monoxide dehydrogenase medium subunit